VKRLLLLTLIVSLSITNVFAQTKISSRLMNAMNQALEDNAPVRALVLINDQVDIQSLDQELYARKADPQDRAYTVITTLKAKADETQPAVISSLNDRSSSEVLTIERFWVANMLLVEAIPSVLVELSQRSDVAYLDLDVQLDWDRPVAKSAAPIESPNGIEPGLAAINAPAMWRAGYTGAGTIVMNIDTGVDGNHVALASRWRGNDPGVPASAAWFEPGGSSTFPYDSDTHGTHTMGIMTGLATATHDTVGVAPGAKWIAANTFTASNFTSANIASYQWAMDPDGNPMTTEDMPVAIGCSWTDPSGGDCATSSYYQIFQTVEAAGIAIVFSAGNSGSGASTITVPKNTNINLVNVWATGAIDGNTPSFPIADFSSRGPSTCGGTGSLLIKPEACAPGVYVRSSTPSNTYAYYDGTSMACPHVVGALALLKEAIPSKTGYELKMALYQTAVDLGTPGEDNDYGMGIIDVYAAYLALIDLLDPKPPVNFTAYSDYLTPSSMLLSWEDPTNFENGDTLLTSQFTIEVERDDGFIASVPGGSETYTDNGLTDGQLYNYTIYAKVITNDSTSFEVETSWYAGGSPFPAPPENLAVVGTTTDATLTWTDPTTQADGTPLDDLAEIRIYRNGTYIATVAPGVQTYLDTPPAGFFYTYTVRAVDNETPENLSVPSNEVGVFVGTTPNFLVWVHPDVAAATASQASGDSIFAALVANGESAFLTDNLFEFGTDLSIYEGIFVVLGIYSNNGVISSSDPEGPALDTYLQNGGHVYLEGGDCFNYDPDVGGYNIRPWFDLNDGADGSGDLIGVIGLNDLSAFTFSYSGDNNYMDELMPIASTPVWQNNANTDISGVFSVGYGSGRAIGVVPSFGGFVNSLEALYPDKRLASYEVSEMKVPSTVGKARIYRERNSLFVKKAAYYPELKKNRDINEQYFKFSGGGVGIEANNKVDLMAAYLGLFRNVGNPQLTLTPTAFSDTLLIGGTVDETLNLTNTGGSLAGDLNFTIAENPAVDWLTVAPTTGTISANQSLEATLTFSAVGLSSGLYSTTLEVTSNDPVNPLQIVNVDLYVNQPPVVGFSPDSMQITLNPGELDSLQMTITNSGLGPLVFQLSTIAGADESVNSGLNMVKLSPPFFLPVNPQKKLTAAGTSSIKASERASSYSTPIYMNPQEAIWDIQFFFDASAASGALGNAGAEFDGNYY
jgi:subtilisin family serine protease